MADAGTRPQLRAHMSKLVADLADEWEPAALYALLAEEASLAAAEARIKERICADASGLGVGQFGRPTRAGRRLCALRVLQYDRAELPGHAQIRAQVAFGAVRATWTCHAQPDSAVLTISAAHGAAGAPARLLRMRATRQPGAERGHCAVQLRPARLERFDTELGLQLGCAALLQLLTGYCSAFVAEEWEWDALLAEALEHRHAHCEQLELERRELGQGAPVRRAAVASATVATPWLRHAPAVAVSTDTPKELTRREMDERIFGFNKVLIDTVYEVICFLYPVTGSDRDFARFYVLETVARVPYFAYLSVMHLRETFGDRDPLNLERMRTHYAEADNELHHLLIMESLGGNSSIVDRTVAQTMAFFYYWYVTIVYFVSEPAAYHLSELIEDHAFYTYDNYLKGNEEQLKSKPVPDIARKYYERDDPFMFNTFCTVSEPDEAASFVGERPKLETLYDVFVNVRNDEREHWKTLCNLVQFDDMQGAGGKVLSTKAAPSELGAA